MQTREITEVNYQQKNAWYEVKAMTVYGRKDLT